MSTLSEFWKRQRVRWHARSVPRCHQLRRTLAYHVARHGFEIGDYSIGAPAVRTFGDSARLKVGRYCSIAAGATFILGGHHRTDAVTTFPLGLAFGALTRDELPTSRGDIVVGSDVWIAANATIVSGVTVGDGAIVGAGAVVIDDVPPYAVVLGNPARVVRKRFPDKTIATLLELRWWELDATQVRQLRPLLQSDDISGFVAACREIKGLPQASEEAVAANKRSGTPDLVEGALGAQLIELIRTELPAFSQDDLDTPFARLAVDSFAMLTLRTRIEQSFATVIDDESWSSVITPGDVVRILAGIERGTAAGVEQISFLEEPSPYRARGRSRPPGARAVSTAPASEQRVYDLNMPQMALGGLSESWLLKEVGDIHWSLITRALGQPSSRLTDAGGNRLYATFTRVQLSSTAPLAAYVENETITVAAKGSRYGAMMFFSDAGVRGDGRSALVRVMSSFSKYGEAGANTSLLKGQPEIPVGCAIPDHADLPEFAHEYRARRAREQAPPIFECQYDIIPPHDINGVGLLYFAAYPIINDLCAMRFAGPAFARDLSTQHRDVFYFANSDPDDTLIYRIHHWNADDDGVEMEASLSRNSDGTLMARMVTGKRRVRM
ncbi:MAG: Pnap_2097 family protein [Xanthobacteraceae bacterium]